LIIAFGVYPKPLLDIINPAVHQTLVQMHATDPLPPAPASTAFFSSHSGFALSRKGPTP
jgi:NADH-quinone oxidoreductase subunit M